CNCHLLPVTDEANRTNPVRKPVATTSQKIIIARLTSSFICPPPEQRSQGRRERGTMRRRVLLRRSMSARRLVSLHLPTAQLTALRSRQSLARILRWSRCPHESS